ncbi:hypothetical protein IET39_002450, partial [Enterococcus faecalis]|nr:hypothetical protein [Enterococcus faecalis]
FKVSEEKFLIVGSAKIGFSLSPYKKLQSFCRGDINNRRQSDIDIAIVSTNIFNKLWDDLKLLKYKTYVNNYNQLSSNVFRGFINDKNINEQISLQADVIDKMDKCTIALRDEFGVVEPVNYRFYYSWDDLKRYTMDGIIKCKGDYHGI